MNSYENEIMDIIPGDTPKQKFDYIKTLVWKNSPEQEQYLLNICYDLKAKGKDLFNTSGSESYVQRCAIYNVEQKVYKLTNKFKFEKQTLDQWLNEIERIKAEQKY